MTQEAAEKVQKKWGDSKNNKTIEFSISKCSNVHIDVTSKIYVKSMLLKLEKLNFSRIAISLFNHINDTSIVSNSSGSFRKSVDFQSFVT